jgi:dTDP-glucose 4,6-dehydratase
MRILITGGCGFLGSHLVEHFLKTTTAELVVLDKLSYASMGFDRLRLVREGMSDPSEFTDRVRMLNPDLTLPLAEGVVREIGEVDYIIHAAAESHVDNSIIDPLPFLQSNVIGTHNLLWAVRQMPSVRRVFVVSTDEVYGPAPMQGSGNFASPAINKFVNLAMDLIEILSKHGGAKAQRERIGLDYEVYQGIVKDVLDARRSAMHVGFDEAATFRPANPYAAAKAGGEMVAMAYANTYRLPITIVNTMNLIGERQHPEKFVPLVIRKILTGETIHIHADPTRTRAGTRFYLHCRTFANALAWLIVGDDENRKHLESYDEVDAPFDPLPLKLHVCGERELSNLELAQIIHGVVERDARTRACQDYELKYELVDFHSSRPGHDLRYAMDDSAIRRMGWQRPMGLEQSLEKTVRWYLSNPQWLGL